MEVVVGVIGAAQLALLGWIGRRFVTQLDRVTGKLDWVAADTDHRLTVVETHLELDRPRLVGEQHRRLLRGGG